MAKTNLLLVFFYFLVVIRCEELRNGNNKNEFEARISEYPSDQKMAMVLFFPFPNNTKNHTFSNADVKHLNMSQKAVIRPCCKSREITGTTTGIQDEVALKNDENCANCQEMFKANLASLLSYCRSSLGLSTAVASLTDENMSGYGKAAFLKASSQMFDFNPKKPALPAKRAGDFDVNNFEYYNKNDMDEFPELMPFTANDDDNIPTYNALPSKGVAFNNINKWSRKIKREILGRPDNTEVFRPVSTKHDVEDANPTEILDVPSMKEKPKTIWDVLGVMSVIKNSFFNSFFNPIADAHKKSAVEENGLNLNMLGRIRDPSLFDLVKSTLQNVELNENGFLVAIIGGNMDDVSTPSSDLMQSVKYAAESIDGADSLLVLSPYCPKTDDKPEDVQKRESESMPLFARGTHSDLLSKAQEVYDVPKLVKNVLSETVRDRRGRSDKSNFDTEFLKYWNADGGDRAIDVAPEDRKIHEKRDAAANVTGGTVPNSQRMVRAGGIVVVLSIFCYFL